LRRNEEAPIPPIRNNVVEYQLNIENFETLGAEEQEPTSDMNWIQDEGAPSHLTEDEYHDYLGINNQLTDDNQGEGDDFWSAQYRVFVDTLQAELQSKHDLRPRQNK